MVRIAPKRRRVEKTHGYSGFIMFVNTNADANPERRKNEGEDDQPKCRAA
jgi:hypothetical protein